jgi:negative regulator of sigma-B (phosphoserine phosphatase)
VRLVCEHLSIPKAGEDVSGDAALVRHTDRRSLIAVIDALGHGPLAASVAKTAIEHLAAAKFDAGVRALIDDLHLALRGSRGAAAMLCIVEGERIEGCGVGNVDLRTYGSRVPVVLTPGVLGRTLNRVRVFSGTLAAGDRLLFFTDGITSRFDVEPILRMPAREACREFVNRYRRSHDDATVLITDIQA